MADEFIIYRKTPCEQPYAEPDHYMCPRECDKGFTLEPVPFEDAVIEVLKRVRWGDGQSENAKFHNLRLEGER